MLNLQQNARPQDDFYLQIGAPISKTYGWPWLFKLVKWHNLTNKDGSKGWFWSVALFWYLRFYLGSTKCDASRTYWYWNGLLGGPVESTRYVMNAWSKEHWSIRFHGTPYTNEQWYEMGSI